MNAVERSERRVRRIVVLKKIYEIEQMNCRICPNRTSRDMIACKTCPIPDVLHELGKQLVSMSDRTNAEKIYEEPAAVKKRPGRKSNVEKKHGFGLTRELFLQERANGIWVMDIQHKYKMSRTALNHYLKKWGFRYLSQDQAKKLLGEVTA